MANHKHNHKKLKKLSRKRIGTSIFLIILAGTLVASIVVVFLSFFVMYMLENKISDGVQLAAYGAEEIREVLPGEEIAGEDTEWRPDTDTEAAIAKVLARSGEFTDWVILAPDGTEVMHEGNLTYASGGSVFDLAGEYSVYADQDMDLLDENGESVGRMLALAWKSLWADDYRDGWSEETMLQQDYWPVAAIGESGYQFVMRAKLVIRRKDLFYAGLIAFVSLMAVFVVMIFMLLNLIFSIRTQRRITRLLYTDTTTCGRNWTFFCLQGQRVLNRRIRGGTACAVVDVHLQKYQNYCACNGIRNGECLLEDLHEALGSCIGKKELCAHYNGADFAMLLSCRDGQELAERVQRIAVSVPAVLQQNRLRLQFGIAYLSTQTQNGEKVTKKTKTDIISVFNNALAARASIADKPEVSYAFFDESLLEQQRWEEFVEDHMEEALLREEFVVYLQPKYDPSNDRLAGAEALVRWNSPIAGFVAPYKFIPIFEKNGFITKLDDYMISHVAALQAQWIAKGKQVVPVSVNVSRAHFGDPDLAEHIRDLVDAYGTPHEYVEIELTESAFFDDKQLLLATVHRLKEYGFDISMDDFGAGYSSLNSLKDLPLDVLKLDAEFFRGENESERGEIVVSEAIRLAKSLHMRIVAEGVEKENQVAFLAKQGCDMIQGYYYAKPMPAAEFEITRMTDTGADSPDNR